MVVFNFSVLDRKHFFLLSLRPCRSYFVVVSVQVDCLCALPQRFLNNLKRKQRFYFT